MISFDRGKEAYEALKIGKFRDCIPVDRILHTNHENAKYGTYAQFKREKEALDALNKCIKVGHNAPVPVQDFNIVFKTEEGYQDFFELEGKKIVYKNKIYELSIFRIGPSIVYISGILLFNYFVPLSLIPAMAIRFISFAIIVHLYYFENSKN